VKRKKMNTTKKIAVVMTVLMVAAAMAAPAAMGATYTATVCSGQQTSIGVEATGFGDILRNNCGELTPSFNLTNIGDWDAMIEAKFETNVSGIYGLTNSSYAIGGSNFSINATDLGGSYISLLDTYTDVEITPQLPDDSNTYDYDAKLCVPSDQQAGIYTGTVVITWSDGATT